MKKEEKNSASASPRDAQNDYIKDPEFFDKLIDDVDLSYLGGEEEPALPPPNSGISVKKNWDTFTVGEVDIAKCFSSLRKSLPKTSPEVQ